MLLNNNENDRHSRNIKELTRLYGFSGKDIVLVYSEVLGHYRGRPVREFVPIFVMREAKKLLRA
jgi:hypothetical protein